MKQTIPNSPFSTRLSGSAKETELRLQSIFRWKKKRPPVVLLFLTALIVLLCFGLVSCRAEPDRDDPDEFFSHYVTDFPAYTYTGEHSVAVDGRVITLEDTPENPAEEMVWDNYRLPFVGYFEPYIAMMASDSLRICARNAAESYKDSISFSSVTVHALSTLTPDDFKATGTYFANSTDAERLLDELRSCVQEYALTEYTLACADLSWEWPEEVLALGPQLGNGRYERLFLLGKTEADDSWKLYECIWGEYYLS